MKNCIHCDDPTENTEKQLYDFVGKWAILCDDCIDNFNDKTGHCSIDCCISGNCDDSC